MTRRVLIRVALALVLIVTTQCSRRQDEGSLVASKWSDKFHHPSCEWAEKIKDKNRVTFATAQEAIDAGLRPCKLCRNQISGLPGPEGGASEGAGGSGTTGDQEEPIRKFESLN